MSGYRDCPKCGESHGGKAYKSPMLCDMCETWDHAEQKFGQKISVLRVELDEARATVTRLQNEAIAMENALLAKDALIERLQFERTSMKIIERVDGPYTMSVVIEAEPHDEPHGLPSDAELYPMNEDAELYPVVDSWTGSWGAERPPAKAPPPSTPPAPVDPPTLYQRYTASGFIGSFAEWVAATTVDHTAPSGDTVHLIPLVITDPK